MEYCGNCGEATEGRYCRMCGMPAGTAPTSHPAYAAAPTAAESTQAMAAVPAAPAYGEPTQVVGTLPNAPTQPPTEFDSLFRTADGSPGAHGQTQILPPVVETDYRMQPPAAPRGTRGPDGDEQPRPNRMVLFGTLGAVVVVAGVILGLLYLGNQGTSTNAGSAPTTTQSGAASATASQGPGSIQLPANGATLAPTTAASTPSAYHGDSFPLGPGSSGSWVKWVQEKLKALGYYHGSTNSEYDQATALAVQQFQAAAGVNGDAAGTVGQHTRLALEAAGTTPSLKPGSRSSSVTRLNESLDLAEGAGLSGSRYSTQTTVAVARYQAAVGLEPTGMVDAATWAKLQSGTLA